MPGMIVADNVAFMGSALITLTSREGIIQNRVVELLCESYRMGYTCYR